MLGLPPGASVLFSRATRWRLVLALAGSLLTTLLDIAGVAALLPLMQLLTGSDRNTGALGLLSRTLGGHPSDQRLAVVIAAGIVVAFALKGVLSITFRWWQLGFVAQQEIETAGRLLRGYLSAPYLLHLQRSMADLMRTMGDAVAQTYSQVVVGALSVTTEAVTILGLGLLLLVANPLPALIAFAYFGVVVAVINWQIKHRSESAGEQMLTYSLAAFKSSIHAIGGVKEITIRRNGEVFAEEFVRSRTSMALAVRRQAFLGELPKYLLEIVFVTGMALMAVVAFSTDGAGTAVGTLALFVGAGTRMLPSLVRWIASLGAVRYGMPGLRLVVADLQEYPGPDRLDRGAATHRAHTPTGDIAVTDLAFRYPGTDDDVLRGVSFTVPQGTSLAVVGPSGSGKTTLVDMLLGLHTPTRGRITVAGTDIHEQLPAWQSSIGMVPQDVFWIDDTLRANIAFGVPPEERDEASIRSAVTRSQLDELVADLPDGLDTLIGDRGVRLSGGQRQRIGIARALYVHPQLIVLDEATSALDNLTERRISETIDSLHGETTMVIVAHRLSTVRNCDQLIFLKDGVIESQGTFEEVRRDNADFARLVELGSLDALEAPRVLPDELAELDALLSGDGDA